jgi:hypothetical protein
MAVSVHCHSRKEFWYQELLRILQRVLRQPDASSYNEDSLANYMNRLHANVWVINGGVIVDYFQNELPIANVNQYLFLRCQFYRGTDKYMH